MNRYNFNNFKNLIPVNSMAVVISILALFVAVSSGSTPCLSADSVCSSGVDPEYTNNLSVKAGTTNKATITHNNLNGDNQYFFPESNYSRTSSVAVLKKGSDQLNILDLNNGSIIVGQSLTTTVGALRVQTSTNPVLQLYGSAGWEDVGTSPPNVFTTINGNTGSLTASTTTTSIKIEADSSTGLTVVASGDKLEIQSSGGGGSFSPNIASYNLDSSLGFTSNPNNYAPQTNPIYLGYNGTTTVMTEMYDIGNCWSTTVGQDPQNSASATMFVYDTNCGAYPYKISYIIQMNDSGQTQTQQQTSKVIAQLYYQEDSSNRQSIKYGDNTVMGYYQYSSSYLQDFNNHFSDEAVVCFGYDTDNSYNNRFFIKVFSQNASHIKGDTADYKMTTVSMERLNLGSLNTCDNSVSPYPSMN